MGIDYVYFAADDDAIAAGALSRPGGPLGRPEVTGQRRRGLFRTEPIVQELGPGYPGFGTRAVDPLVALGTLTELLTGIDYDTVQDDLRHGAAVASTSTGDRMVLTLSGALRDAIATVEDERLDEVAQAWGRTEELVHVDVDDLRAVLRRLRELSRLDARSRLYAYVSM